MAWIAGIYGGWLYRGKQLVCNCRAACHIICPKPQPKNKPPEEFILLILLGEFVKFSKPTFRLNTKEVFRKNGAACKAWRRGVRYFRNYYKIANHMTTRTEILKFVIDEYYQGDPKNAATATGYSIAQINAWLSGKHEPQKTKIEFIIQCAFVPEFKVIAEFFVYDYQKPLQTQLKQMLGDHASDPGIYAFYDSMANLIYVGKATKLLREIGAALNRTVHVTFPKGIKDVPQKRTEIVTYVSAYDVGKVKWSDFPKHVESLILRISKPLLNKNIGTLQKAFKQPKET